MKEEKYYILMRNLNDDIIVETVKGKIYHDSNSGLSFGYAYNKGMYDVTELSTGLLVSSRCDQLSLETEDMIAPFIDSIRARVVRALKAHPEFQERFANLTGIKSHGKKKLW